MRTITLNDGREMGTNTNDGGVFCRRTDGTWGQWSGNSQTPTFTTARQFLAYLKKHWDGFEDAVIVRQDF